MKLYQILKDSIYKESEIKFFKSYEHNYAKSPVNIMENEKKDDDSEKESDKDDSKKKEVIKPQPKIEPKKDDTEPLEKDKKQVKHDVSSKELMKKDYAYQDIIKYGAYMGEGLYTISEYEYSHNIATTEENINQITKGRGDNNPVFFNKLLYNVINRIKTKITNEKTLNNFLRTNPEDFWNNGAIHCIIYDSYDDSIYFYYVNPLVHRHSNIKKGDFEPSSLEYVKKDYEDSLSPEQEDLIDNVLEIGDTYISSFRRNPKSRETVLLRYKLLYALGMTLEYLPPMQIDQ